LKNKIIVVTGGCGFIGSFLVNKLLSLGVSKVIVIDNYKYGNKSNLPLSNNKINIYNISLESKSVCEISDIIKGTSFVFHLAAEKYNQSLDNPLNILDTNIIGMTKLIEACLEVGVEKIIFSSSVYAYGRNSLPEMKENEHPKPTTIYGISKLAGEQILANYSHKGFEYNILRYFFVYGPKQYSGMGYKSVIIKNFERMLLGKPPIIMGDGLQKLDYSYVEDIIIGTISAMTLDVDKEIINLGSGTGTSIKELVDKMQIIADFIEKPIYGKEDNTAGTVRVSDNNKAINLLEYNPQTILLGGLEKTYKWLKNE